MIDPREALLENVKIKAHNVYSTYETGFFEYSWKGRTKKDHFKKIKKRINFNSKLENVPNDIIFTDVILNNCSNLKIEKINKKGFTISFQGIRALENSIEFNYNTI
jgi:hypothetical protein